MEWNGNLVFAEPGFGELRNAVIERLPSNPVTGLVAGRIYYNTVEDEYRYYNGTTSSWKPIGSSLTLDDLSDVNLAGSPTLITGMVLTYNGTVWKQSISGSGVTDHLLLSNIGTNTHAQIDAHISGSPIHFTQAEISITESQVSDLQPYLLDITNETLSDLSDVASAGSPTLISGMVLTFDGTTWRQATPVSGVTDHLLLSNIGTNTHAQIDSHVGDATLHFTEGSIDHTAIANVGSNTHAQLDSHVVDGTLHFTEGSIDHTAITNVGSNTHAQIDSHVGDATIHYTQASISITESQISDLQAYLLDITGESLGDLSDVDIAGSPILIDGMVLTYNGTRWEHRVAGSGVSDHTLLSNIGTNTHDQIDTHIATGSPIHFTQAQISITESQVSDLQPYLLDINSESLSDLSDVASAGSPTILPGMVLTYIDGKWRQQTPASGVTDHTLLSNIGTNTHAQIDTHIATGSPIHFLQSEISITESQVSDLQPYLLNITNESIGDLSDVAIGSPVALNSVIKWNGTSWVPAVDLTGGSPVIGGATSLNGLTDVSLGSPITNGYALVYNSTTQMWEPGVVAGSGSGLTYIGTISGGTGTLLGEVTNIPSNAKKIICLVTNLSITVPGADSYASIQIGDDASYITTDDGVTVYTGTSSGRYLWSSADSVPVAVNNTSSNNYSYTGYIEFTKQNSTNSWIVTAELGRTTDHAFAFITSGYSTVTNPVDRIRMVCNGSGTFNSGQIEVFVADSSGTGSLNDLTDVTLGSPITDNYVLTYNASTGLWEPAAPTGGGSPAGITDHTLLTNIGTNTHAQIDTHIATGSPLHYPMTAISITESQISDLGSYEPAFAKNTAFNKDFGTGSPQVARGNHLHTGVYEPANANIQSHIGDSTIHFTKESIALEDLSNVASQGSPTIIPGMVLTYNGTRWAQETPASGVTDHTLLTNIGTNTHAQIDTHIATGSPLHYPMTAISITESQISDLGSYEPANVNIQTHIATGSPVHFLQSEISINESQVSDLQSYLLNINNESLGDLSDVSLGSPIALDSVIKWNGTSWVPAVDLTGGSPVIGGASYLNELLDVSLTGSPTPAINDYLQWNGTDWTNTQSLAGGNGATLLGTLSTTGSTILGEITDIPSTVSHIRCVINDVSIDLSTGTSVALNLQIGDTASYVSTDNGTRHYILGTGTADTAAWTSGEGANLTGFPPSYSQILHNGIADLIRVQGTNVWNIVSNLTSTTGTANFRYLGLSIGEMSTATPLDRLRVIKYGDGGTPGTFYSGTVDVYAIESNGIPALDDLTDVTLGSPITDGYALVYNSSLQIWEPGTVTAGASALDDLTDVVLGSPITTNDALVYNGTNWVPGTVTPGASALADLTDVTIGSPPLVNDYLRWNGTEWINVQVEPGGSGLTHIGTVGATGSPATSAELTDIPTGVDQIICVLNDITLNISSGSGEVNLQLSSGAGYSTTDVGSSMLLYDTGNGAELWSTGDGARIIFFAGTGADSISHTGSVVFTRNHGTNSWACTGHVARNDTLPRVYVSEGTTTTTGEVDRIKLWTNNMSPGTFASGTMDVYYVSSGSATTLDALTDVTLGSPITDNYVLTYNASTGKWEPAASAGAVGSPAGVTDHTLLSNIGTNTHAQIDTHIATGSPLHYPMTAISITESQISDLGSYEPANVNIQTHIATGSPIHFLQSEISITESQISDFGSYEPAFAKNTAFNKDFGTGSPQVARGNHLHTGVYEPANANIQSHIGDSTIHFTKESIALENLSNVASQGSPTIVPGMVLTYNGTRWAQETPASGVTDHTLLSNIGTNTHAQIDTHIATGSPIHFLQSEISITESQISDLQAYLLDITAESIGDLTDVDLTGSPALASGDALIYNAGLGAFAHGSLAGPSGERVYIGSITGGTTGNQLGEITGISSGYDKIELIFSGVSPDAGTSNFLYVVFGDAGGYNGTSGGTLGVQVPPSGQASVVWPTDVGIYPSAIGTTDNLIGNIILNRIPGTQKWSVSSNIGDEGGGRTSQASGFIENGTTEIERIKVILNTNNFDAGSVEVYGYNFVTNGVLPYSIETLNDVQYVGSPTAPLINDVLQWSGSYWENVAANAIAGGVAGLTYIGTISGGTTGTLGEIIGVPASAERIVCVVRDMGLNVSSGTAYPTVQIGDTASYSTTDAGTQDLSATAGIAWTTGNGAQLLSVGGGGNTLPHSGIIELLKSHGTNTWVINSALARTSGTSFVFNSVGYSTVSGTVDRIRINNVTGTAGTFSGGTVDVFVTELYVDLNGIPGLDDLSDVTIGGSPITDNSVLTYDSGTGQWGPETPAAGVTDHTLLTNIGTNTHAQIDTHIATGSPIHFLQSEISITESQISDLGSYEPANVNIQTHIATGSPIHFLQSEISITESQISDLGTYEPAFAKNTAFNKDFGTGSPEVARGNHLHTGVYEPANANIQNHIATGSPVHFLQSEISITESQISDLQSYLLDITGESIKDLSDVYSAMTPQQGQILTYDTTNGWQAAVNQGATGSPALSNDHLLLTNIGTNTHAQIDTHIATGSPLHYPMTAISITESQISDLGSYEPANANIQTHIATGSPVHFLQSEISITESQISDLQSYLLDITSQSINDLSDVDVAGSPTLVSGMVLTYNGTKWDHQTPTSGVTDHTLLSNIGTNTHAQIDTHIATGSPLHYPMTAISITESQISDLGSYEPANANIQTHIATGSPIHFLQSEISITESQISDLGTYEPAFAKNTAFNKDFGTGSPNVARGNHLHVGVYEPANANIQSHISDGTIHFTKESIALENLSNVASQGSPAILDGMVLTYNGTRWQQETPAAAGGGTLTQYIYDSTLNGGSPLTTLASHPITHGLGQKFVNVTVYQDIGSPAVTTQIVPTSVILNSANVLTITFDEAIDCHAVITGDSAISPAGG